MKKSGRPPRIHEPNTIHHVMVRGNNRQRVFYGKKYFDHFLEIVSDSAKKFDHKILAYCLMTNHIHLIVQINKSSLSNVMQYINFRYARWANKKLEYVGHMFQERFHAIRVNDEKYLLNLCHYIHFNPAADKYGAKNLFISAMGLFTVMSVFCGFAHILSLLVIARFVQGIGGAFMISLGRLILARTFKRHELVEATNTVIVIVAMAVMMGPFIGGVIVDHLSWPWIFWVNIPVGILVIFLAIYGLKETATKSPRPFDFLGFILFGGSLAMLCYALSEMSQSNTHLESAFMRLGIALMMLVAYIFHAKRKKHPAIRIELLKLRTFRISVFGNLCARLGFAGIPFLFPLLQQVGFGFSAELSGLLLMPSALGIIFSKLFAIKILRKIGYKKFLLINTFFVGLVLWSFQLIDAQTPIYMIAFCTFIFGVATSAQYTGMNSLALAEIKDEELSASTSITSTMQILAQSLGVAVGAILLRIFSSQQSHSLKLTPEIFHDAFFALGILTFLSSLIFMQLKAGDGKQMLMKAEA